VEPEPLISRDELTAMLFAVQDIREDVRDIRDWLVEDNGEASEENT
jgi:hypothetical protein